MISGTVPTVLAGIVVGKIALSSCILTAVLVAMYVLLTAGLHKFARKSVAFHLIGAVLTVLLLVQSVMFFGIGAVRGMGRSVLASGGETAEVFVERVRSLPLPESVRTRISQEIDNSADAVSDRVASLQKQIRSYRWQRVGWMVAFEVVAVLLAWLLMSKGRPAPASKVVSYDDF